MRSLRAAVVGTWIGIRRQQSALAAATAHLLRRRAGNHQTVVLSGQLFEDLPALAARYLRLAIPAATQMNEIRLRQTGTLRTAATSERWVTFAAEHLVVPAATGVLWNARVQVAPLLHVRVRDALIDGNGSGQVSLLSQPSMDGN